MRPPITTPDQGPANDSGKVTDHLAKQARQQTLTDLPPSFYTKLEKRFEAEGSQFDSHMRLSPSTPKLFSPLTRIEGLLTCSSAIRVAKDFWFFGSVRLNLPKLEQEAALIFNVAANGHNEAMLKPFWNDQLLAPAIPIASTLQNPNPDFWLITPWTHGENVLDLKFEGAGFLSIVHIDVHHVVFCN